MNQHFKPKIYFLFFLCITIPSLYWYFFFTPDIYKPIHQIEVNSLPVFSDDSDYNSLLIAGRKHASYLAKKGSSAAFNFGSKSYQARWLLESLNEFTTKIAENPSPEELQKFILKNYDIYQAGGRKSQKKRKMLVTGYYEPVFEGSLIKTTEYIYPIYSPPDNLIKRNTNGDKEQIGRIGKDGFRSYWSRAEIEQLGVAAGYEMAYLKDPLDAFLLQVQGSGRIRLADGTVKAIRFATSNGLEYKSIGKLLVDEKRMTLAEVTVPAIRKYLEEHPAQLKRILHHNPRFIFFSWGDSNGPRGSSGEVLTPGRSIAIDNSALPDGAIGYLTSQKPLLNQNGEIIDWVPLRRFVFPQDSGAAIQGTGRVDMFWGNGYYAEFAANHMKEAGKLYFLVKKRPAPPDTASQ